MPAYAVPLRHFTCRSNKNACFRLLLGSARKKTSPELDQEAITKDMAEAEGTLASSHDVIYRAQDFIHLLAQQVACLNSGWMARPESFELA